ncbi:MAG TPA: glycosyltransferase family 4 protein [Gaiellaceae bacterium]|nr:glycosyltransferase family 4 protein [Gaiellaceae bacterium]
MPERGRLTVVSHACVLAVNQLVYARLLELGWDVTLVVPASWRHEYAAAAFPAERLPELADRIEPRRVALAGRPQRHLYIGAPVRVLRRTRPDVLFLDEEPFSVPALQWARAARRLGVPFGCAAFENLDRPFPLPARLIRSRVLPRARFLAARSPAAADLLRRWGARSLVGVAPPAVPEWPLPEPRRNGGFTVGYAGRLVPEKGVLELARATQRLEGARLLLVGEGPLRAEAEALGAEVRTTRHEAMAAAYAEMDVLALPSRTTATWAEQFGRVLVEALWCGVPVVGSDSGEIPWVIETTGGGLVVPEGDEDALAAALRELRDDPRRRAELAERGRREVAARFSVEAAAGALDRLLLEART